MNGEFRAYRHEGAGFSLPVHELWRATEEVPGCALVAVEPDDDPEHFSANVVEKGGRRKQVAVHGSGYDQVSSPRAAAAASASASAASST